MKKYALILVFCGLFSLIHAQESDPVFWTFSIKESTDTSLVLNIQANIDRGWYIYSEDLPQGGPFPLTFIFTNKSPKEVSSVTALTKPHEMFDEIFGITVRYYEETARFEHSFVTDGEKFETMVITEAQACNKIDGRCVISSSIVQVFAAKREGAWKIVDIKVTN